MPLNFTNPENLGLVRVNGDVMRLLVNANSPASTLGSTSLGGDGVSSHQDRVVLVKATCGTLSATSSAEKSGKCTLISIEPSSTGDTCYLPWNSGRAVGTQLTGAHSSFVTANMNGCCTYVSGDPGAPFVVHANCVPDRANDFSLHPGPAPKKSAGKVAQAKWQQGVDAYETQKLRTFAQVYSALAAMLIDDGMLSGENLVICDMNFYASTASVFGIKSGSWSFYCCNHNDEQTTKMWPPA